MESMSFLKIAFICAVVISMVVVWVIGAFLSWAVGTGHAFDTYDDIKKRKGGPKMAIDNEARERIGFVCACSMAVIIAGLIGMFVSMFL